MAQCRLAAARRAYQRNSLTGADIQSYIRKNILQILAVSKAYMVITNISFDILKFSCARFVNNIRLGIHQLGESLKPGHAHRVLLRKCGELSNRCNER